MYRGRDTKLGREVALKVSQCLWPMMPATSRDSSAKRKALASLNHPNIAQIYGLEENAIVMELVEGRTLAGAIPLDQTLSIARQIAEALEAAHEKGIIRRDLKPANVKITPHGVVKVLDFGLAKAGELELASVSPENSPTLTLAGTHGAVRNDNGSKTFHRGLDDFDSGRSTNGRTPDKFGRRAPPYPPGLPE